MSPIAETKNPQSNRKTIDRSYTLPHAIVVLRTFKGDALIGSAH